MATLKLYKLRDKNTGLFAAGQQHYRYRAWRKDGRIFRRKGNAVAALKYIGMASNDPSPSDVEIVEYTYKLLSEAVL